MPVNQKEFARIKGVSVKQIKKWIDQGYMPHATINQTTKVYSIPEDTPVPFHGKNIDRIKNIDTLIVKLLEAASASNSVFSTMFPKISTADFDATIASLTRGGFIEEISTVSGDVYLRITVDGALLKHNFKSGQKVGHASFMDLVNAGGVILQLINSVFEAISR